jgi:hypothetical protein
MSGMGTQFGSKNADLNATETTEQNLGTIKVPKGASRITGISAAVVLQTGTAAEGTLAHARLSFTGARDIKGIPCAVVISEELGGSYTPQFTPCMIAVAELTEISCFATATLAQTGTAHALICLRFE